MAEDGYLVVVADLVEVVEPPEALEELEEQHLWEDRCT